MTKFSWNQITGHKETHANMEQAQPAENTLPPRRDSKLSHVMDSIRHALAHEHETLPQNLPHAQTGQQEVTGSGNNTSISPALQALDSSKLNENAMGEDSHWGWPGLGTFKTHDSITAQNNKSRTSSTGSNGNTQARAEAATFEAIDNAAESESFGWPGLGTWSTAPRK